MDRNAGSDAIPDVLPSGAIRGMPAPDIGQAGLPLVAQDPGSLVIELTENPIDFPQLTESVRDPDCGAVVLFLGTVREVTGGQRTSFLEYEAFPAMARESLHALESEVRKRYPVRHVAIVHRTGHLGPGEVSVAVAVSAPHRAAAFDAGRWLIDTLKERVPIWKKEHYADGRTEWQHGQVPETQGPVIGPMTQGPGAGHP